MVISLIGMSGVGKSYWSKKLKDELAFQVFSCDDEIEKALSPILSKLGYNGINDVSKWMGQPYQESYSENSQKYLDLENKVLEKILEKIEKDQFNNQKLVIDTTGSVVYCRKDLQQKLKKLSKIIYFKAQKEDYQKMYETFIKDPKPIIWGDDFKPLDILTDKENLKVCYPNLLQFRSQKYQELGDKAIQIKNLHSEFFKVEDLFL